MVDATAGLSKRENNVGRAADYLQQLSCCPACQQQRGALLILPCSHPLCARCISAAEAANASRRHRSAGCAVACPSCRHPVELPCWNWASAASCLPKHPAVSPAWVHPSATRDPHHQVRRACFCGGKIKVSNFRGSHFCPLGSIYLEARALSGCRTGGHSETPTR